MAILLYDIETTGLINFQAGAEEQTARICEIAAILLNADTLEQIGEPFCELIKPDGWVIEADAQEVHGISLEQCEEFGIPIADAIERFDAMADQATVLSGFSMRYDNKGVRGERRRLGRDDRYGVLPELDVMYAANPFTNAKNGKGGKKMPSLKEAFEELTGQPMPDAHTALGDVEATATVLRILRERFKISLAGKYPKTAEEKAAEPAKAKPKARKPFAPFNPDETEVF